jgi:hypothetical protein
MKSHVSTFHEFIYSSKCKLSLVVKFGKESICVQGATRGEHRQDRQGRNLPSAELQVLAPLFILWVR